MCGWQHNGPPPHDHILVPGTCKCYRCGEKGFAGVTNQGLLNGRRSWITRVGLSNHKALYKGKETVSGKQMSERGVKILELLALKMDEGAGQPLEGAEGEGMGFPREPPEPPSINTSILGQSDHFRYFTSKHI